MNLAPLRNSLVEHGIKIVLEGTHSTGKTTLAKNLAQALGLPLIPEPARPVLASRGITAAFEGCDPWNIALIQTEIMLEHLGHETEAGGEAVIMDRGAVSVYAYTLARVSRNPECAHALHLMRKQVEYAAARPGRIYLFVPPNIPLSVDDVREGNEWYREHISLLIWGMLEQFGYAPRCQIAETTEEARLKEALRLVAMKLGFNATALEKMGLL